MIPNARWVNYIAACALLLLRINTESARAPALAPPQEWLGTWLIVHDLGAPGISALTDQQSREMIGRKIVVTQGRARFADDICRSATYAVDVLRTEDFLLGYNITPTQLPLVGKEVRTLEVSCDSAAFHGLSSLRTGCVILVWEGRFFEVARSGTKSKPARCLKGIRN